MNRWMYLGLIAFTAFTGCASVHSATYYTNGEFAPTDPRRVQIYSQEPPRQHILLGEIRLDGPVIFEGDRQKIRTQAAAMGADGVYCREIQNCDQTLVPAQKKIEHNKDGQGNEVTTIETAPVQIGQNCAIVATSCQALKFQ